MQWGNTKYIQKYQLKKNMTEPAMYFTDFYCRQFFKRAIYSFVLDLSSFLKSFKNTLHTTQKYAKFWTL